jgi:phospholipase D1/2
MLKRSIALRFRKTLDHRPIANQKMRTSHVRRLAALLGLLALAAAWQWLLPDRWPDFEAVAAWQRSFQAHSLAPVIVIAAYVLGGIVLFPVTVLSAATIVTFGPVMGNLYGLAGWLASASLGFCVGRYIGQDWLSGLLDKRFEGLRRVAKRRGLLAVLGLRVVPAAPFSIVNLFIGASGIRFSDFILGSILGRIPGTVAFTLFAVQLQSLVYSISLAKFLMVMVGLTVVFGAQRWMTRRLAAASAPLETPALTPPSSADIRSLI